MAAAFPASPLRTDTDSVNACLGVKVLSLTDVGTTEPFTASTGANSNPMPRGLNSPVMRSSSPLSLMHYVVIGWVVVRSSSALDRVAA